jgi:hypothetical protein
MASYLAVNQLQSFSACPGALFAGRFAFPSLALRSDRVLLECMGHAKWLSIPVEN